MRRPGPTTMSAVGSASSQPSERVDRELPPAKDFLRLVDDICVEIKGHIDSSSIAGDANLDQQDDLATASVGRGFRPLTEQEKKEFVDSLDRKGRQILAELAGEPKSSSDLAFETAREEVASEARQLDLL